MTASRRTFSMTLGLLAAVAGCGVSPQPSPPDFILEGDRIGLTPGAELVGGLTGFEAQPGAVHPAEGIVVVTNLDTSDAPSVAKVQADGSFAIGVPGVSGQRYRFQAKSGDARSEPFDVDVDPTGIGITADATADCLVIDPARWLALEGAGDARSIIVRNDCPGPVTLAAPHLRRGLGGFSFTPTTPLALAAGSSATLTVRAGDGVEVEDVLSLDLTGPAVERRGVTLTVPDR